MSKIVIGASLATATVAVMAVSAPAYARDISITATARAEHQSNAAHASAAQAAATGLTRSDQIFSPGVAVNVDMPFAAHNFTLSGSANYVFHRRNTKRNRESLNFSSALAMNLPICDPSVTASLSRQISDLGDIVTSPGANPITVENVETVKAIGGTIACGRDFGIRPTFSASYEEGRNDEALRKLRDRNVVSYSAGLAYVHPLIGELQLFGQQREIRYPNQILPDLRENGSRQRSFGARFSRSIGTRLQGSAEVTYADLKSRQPGVPGFKGLNWAANLSAQATSRTTVKASIARNTSSSLAVDANYFVNTNYSLSAGYVVSPLLSLQAGATATRRKFEGTQVVAGQQALTGDRRYAFSASANYQFSPKLSFSLSAVHERRNGSGTFFDYTNNRIGLSANLAL